MGSALLEGILKAKHCLAADVRVYDTYQPAAEKCVKDYGLVGADSAKDVFAASDAVLLCVKPQDVPSTLSPLPNEAKDKLLISIAAGITLSQLDGLTQAQPRLVRVMPNTPALVGKGASGFVVGPRATPDDATLVKTILDSVGISFEVTEKQLDAVTGLSGSGPAYIFSVIEALADGGVLEGLPKPMALALATQTVLGAATLVSESGEHPAKLRDNVTSPGGTTIAGLAQLERQGLRSALMEAVSSATKRSRELGSIAN